MTDYRRPVSTVPVFKATPEVTVGPVTRLPTAVVAAGSLLLGFGVADWTGQRWLGGLVLLAAVIWCWPWWRRTAGTQAALGLLAGYVVAFVASHLIAGALGAWTSVVLVSALVGAGCWLVADAPARRALRP